MLGLEFLKKNRIRVLIVVTLAFLAVAIPVFADTSAQAEQTADIGMASINKSSITNVIQTVANVLATIGAGVILIYGMIHTFGVASAGKNANKRAMAMESLGYVFLSIFIFFGLSKLGGVIRGIAEGITATASE